MDKHVLAALTSVALLPVPAFAQDHTEHDHATHDHMAHQQNSTDQNSMPEDSVSAVMPENSTKPDHSMHHHAVNHDGHDAMAQPSNSSSPAYATGSGTSRLPAYEGAMDGLHVMSGDWMFMAHGFVSTQYTDHSGPRGDDKTYVVSMAMATAERDTSFGKIQFRSMLSLDPLMSNRGYPNLFATGETANGIPLVDRQHPHDLFMELAVRVDFDLTENLQAFIYGGPVGEPALGPSAFMMRRSSKYNPEAPVTHHWFDSTHITYGVVTAGLASSKWQLETSAFRGAEPDEDRWDIETPRLDSWSARATWTPTPNWALQASYGQIHQPEAMHPGQNEHRFTASAHYTNQNGLSASAAFSSKNRQPGQTLTAWLAEANWDVDSANSVFARVENVANDELFIDHHDPRHDQKFRVSKFQAGYARRINLKPFELAMGASLNTYVKPDSLDAVYGKNPWGYTLFLRLSLGS